MRSSGTRGGLAIALTIVLSACCPLIGHFALEARGEGARVEIVDAFWGTSGNPMAVGPGDEGVILTVVLQNSGTEVVSGVNLFLYLRPPLRNATGGDVAKGYVASTLQPGQLTNVQFLLNVDDNASVGRYYLEAEVHYMTLKQTSETQSSSVSESEQKGTSASRTSTSQSSSTSGTPPATNTTTSSSSDTSQTSTSSTRQTSSSSSVSYTRYSADRIEQSFNVTLWITGKVVLDVNLGVDSIFAGSGSIVPIEIANRGSAPASSLSVALTLPSGVAGSASSVPLVLTGNDNYWYFQSLPAGESVTVHPTFFASNSAIDGTFQIQVTMSYRDNVGAVRTEQRSIGILVKGPIRIVLQDVAVMPSVVGAGGNVTVAGTIMNEGAVSAMYMNASLLTVPPFVAYDGARSYIGEVSPNTPMPFSLSVGVSRDAENGTYTLPLLLYYKDSYHNTYSIEVPLRVTVQGVVQPPSSEQPRSAELFSLTRLATLALIAVVAALSSAATYFLTKRGSKSEVKETKG